MRAITRVVRSGEEQLVNDLVTVAQHGTVRQLESMVRGLRTIEDNDPPETPSDYLAHSWGGDSRWRMQARLDPESGAVVETDASYPDVVDPSAFIRTATPLEDEHADLAADAAASRWTGDRLDHPYAVACLATSRASAA